MLLKTGGGENTENRQRHKPATKTSGTGTRAIEEAKNRSVSHLRRRQDVFWSILQGVLSQPTPQLMVTQKMAMWRWGGVRSHRGAASPIPGSRTVRGLSVRCRRIDAAVADGWCWRAEAKGEADAGDGRCSATLPKQGATDGQIIEYELICWLL